MWTSLYDEEIARFPELGILFRKKSRFKNENRFFEGLGKGFKAQ
jgi:hypothetical protein